VGYLSLGPTAAGLGTNGGAIWVGGRPFRFAAEGADIEGKASEIDDCCWTSGVALSPAPLKLMLLAFELFLGGPPVFCWVGTGFVTGVRGILFMELDLRLKDDDGESPGVGFAQAAIVEESWLIVFRG